MQSVFAAAEINSLCTIQAGAVIECRRCERFDGDIA